MEKLDKVIRALECCLSDAECDFGCPYWVESESSDDRACDLMHRDALEVIRALVDDLRGAQDEIHRLMRSSRSQPEEPCGTCEYNLKMLREYHVMYLPDTCPRRSSGECPEEYDIYNGIMVGLEQALAYERGEIELLTHTRSTEDEESGSDG